MLSDQEAAVGNHGKVLRLCREVCVDIDALLERDDGGPPRVATDEWMEALGDQELYDELFGDTERLIQSEETPARQIVKGMASLLDAMAALCGKLKRTASSMIGAFKAKTDSNRMYSNFDDEDDDDDIEPVYRPRRRTLERLEAERHVGEGNNLCLAMNALLIRFRQFCKDFILGDQSKQRDEMREMDDLADTFNTRLRIEAGGGLHLRESRGAGRKCDRSQFRNCGAV